MYLNTHITERLQIRPLTEKDTDVWEKFFHYPECIQYLPLQKDKNPNEKAAFWIEKQLMRYKENRYGLMALVHRETNELIGQCGLLTQEVDHEPVLEIGYHLFPQHWKQGYATEAATFFKNLGFKNAYANELVSIIDVGNHASEKVATRNGMKKIKTTKFWDLQVNVFSIQLHEWKKTQ